MITYLQNDKTSSKHSQEVFRFFVLYNSYLQRKEKTCYYFDQSGEIKYFLTSFLPANLRCYSTKLFVHLIG